MLKIVGRNQKGVERDRAARPVRCSLPSALLDVIIFDLFPFIFKNLSDDLGTGM